MEAILQIPSSTPSLGCDVLGNQVLKKESQLLGMLSSLDVVASLGHPRSKVQLLIPQGLLSTLLLML
jgi:hypothetical protein